MGGINSFEKPEFEALEVKKGAGYELRKYKQAYWTSTAVKASDFDKSTSTAFRRLFQYIRGANEPENKVSMTVPVTMAIKSDTADGETEMVMSFYLPKKHQQSPPAPTEAGVYTEHRDELTVFVRQFGGFAKGKDWFRESASLREDLKRDGVTDVDRSVFYAVAYNSPFRRFWRTNEVWIRKMLIKTSRV